MNETEETVQLDRIVVAYKAYIRFLRKAQQLQEFCEWNELSYPEPLRRMLGKEPKP